MLKMIEETRIDVLLDDSSGSMRWVARAINGGKTIHTIKVYGLREALRGPERQYLAGDQQGRKTSWGSETGTIILSGRGLGSNGTESTVSDRRQRGF